TCLSTNYRGIYLTARDDGTIGAPIGTNALSGYYATNALELDYASAGAPFSFRDIRISYADTGINFSGGRGHVFSHAQLVNCNYAYKASSATASFRNVLLSSVGTVCNGSGASSATSHWEHVSVNVANNFN